jgi:hypothetical protein
MMAGASDAGPRMLGRDRLIGGTLGGLLRQFRLPYPSKKRVQCDACLVNSKLLGSDLPMTILPLHQ